MMKVLLAVDGSECSKNAVHEVATRPWRDGTELKIISIIEEPFQYLLTDPFLITEAIRVNLMEKEDEKMNSLLEELKASIHSAKMSEELEIETEVIWGSPKRMIVEEAEKWEADLIVVGCHGYGNIKRFLLGSVSQSVAMHAPCSVEIVRCPKKDV
jgi:nucleotide-binding universal stress UspA family protein